ncbi:SpoIIE family protein phosphatase [Cellulomonas triticagri]|uniref:GAF domain-containing protein n=1 Tax=Cellulomonas triticagri TaxID=2483352 RepID=A0A3M2JJJ3_9CELL|nr:SpoIIE family protein phosphatase [Cellulomonas triticagri]RMI13972.1 GAF domain-containing protein [Cellulomonas triticagri]
MTEQTFLAPGEPVDLDNCAREPIHIPGSVQPRGVLLVVQEAGSVVLQASANVETVLGRPVDVVLGRTLGEVLGESPARVVLEQLAAVPDHRTRNPGLVHVDAGGRTAVLDVVVHRPPPATAEDPGPVFVVELEVADGPRPLTYASTYESVRDAIADLNRAGALTDLYDTAARHVRRLTGFDRVMIYRFDAEYNGEVVAEAKRADLEPFLGLHYPASDIPPQARALYEKSWIRLISDVDYVPVPVLPTDEPLRGAPLDLTYATLRSVSPIHCEYLRNMGVRASMSISLLRDGKLWGMVACHHYAGPHAPSYGVRAAAEFLGVALSARLVAQVEEDLLAESRRASGVLARLVAASRDEDVRLAQAVTRTDDLLSLVPADGVVVCAGGDLATRGRVPDEAVCRALASWGAGVGDTVHATDHLAADPGAPEAAAAAGVAGAVALALPDGGAVVWLREEVVRTVDWGGDPHHKALVVPDGDGVRLSPRQSFDLWREHVRGRSAPWDERHVSNAGDLRGHLVEALFRRGQAEVSAARAIQRTLLPTSLPSVPGWAVDARYEPAGTGQVGGDWYDVVPLPDGRIALVVGDVTGHGLATAAAMGQLRNATRAYLVDAAPPAVVLARVGALARWSLPGQMATMLVAVLDPATGDLEYAKAGHLPPLVVRADGAAAWEPVRGSALIGLLDGEPATAHVALGPGDAVLLLTDGVVERRGESLRVGLDRAAADVGRPAVGHLDALVDRLRDPASDDDATLVLLARD